MTRILQIAVAAFLSIAGTFGQGTIYFSTRFAAAGVNAPCALFSGFPNSPAGPGPAYSAALYLVNADHSLTLIPTSLTTFRDGTENPLLAQYVNPVTAEVPGAAAGSSVTVRMRAWLTAQGSYDAAVFSRGDSMDFLVQNLGGGANPPADLPRSFTGFIIGVPEPSVIAFGVLGSLILFAFRRSR